MITRDTDEPTHPRIVRSSGWGGVNVGSLAEIGWDISGGVVLTESLVVRVRHGLGLWCVVLGEQHAGNEIHK